MSGVLYGVGVGPGDPELMTLKAHKLISRAPVAAYLVNGQGKGLARDIAGDALNPGAEHIPVLVPMALERGPAQAAYDKATEAFALHLDAGRDVVFLCVGDPFFYGSFMYVFTRLRRRFTCRVVPGVTSLTACAAELGRPLAARNDILKVLPAPLADRELERELVQSDAVAIIKIGRHFTRVRTILDRLGMTPHAHVIERASVAEQKVTPLADVPDGGQLYFSTILIYKGGEPW
jgi:precorrin-2/cobalt-factor-2 C20-methyltransferase